MYLHHQQERIEYDQHHDKVFERRGDDNSPDFILETVPLAGHVTFQRSHTDSEIYARFLERD